MVWSLSVHSFPLALAGSIAVVLAAALWRTRKRRGGRELSMVIVSVALWSFGQAVVVTTDSLPVAAAGAGLTRGGFALIATAWLLFALEYTGTWEEKLATYRPALWVVPAVYLGLVVTDPLHGQVLGEPVVTGSGTVEHPPGPVDLAYFAYAYVLLGLGEVVLVRKAIHSRNVYRKRTVFLAIVVFPLWIPHVVSTLGASPLPGYTVGPYAFLLVGMLSLLVTFSTRFLMVLPLNRLFELFGSPVGGVESLARDVVIEEMGSGILVVDGESRIVDLNPMARKIFAAENRRIVGKPLDEVLTASMFVDEEVPGFVQPGRSGTYEGVWAWSEDGTQHCYDVVITDLSEKRDDATGRVGIVHDVTDSQRRKRELEQRTEELQRQNEQLEEFASIVSHDLRNPLTVAEGYVDAGVESGDPSYYEEVRVSLDRMKDIIDDVLTLARQGRTVQETEPVDLSTLAAEAWNHVDSDGATLVVETDLVVEADRGRLLQVFENLFRNSVEHGSTGGRSETEHGVERGSGDHRTEPERGVEHTSAGTLTDSGDEGGQGNGGVRVEVGDLEDGFYVADDGPGIDESERDRVLERGYTTTEDGTGFGLSIVSTVAEAHGWTVTVTESADGGARFEFTDVDVAGSRHPGGSGYVSHGS